MNFNKSQYVSDKIKDYYKNKHINEIKLNKAKIKRRNDRNLGGFHKIYDNIIKRINIIYKKNNLDFDVTFDEIIGCSFDFLEEYIKNKLKDNMTIDNYGEWEIDHIIPVPSFDFSRKYNILKCFNYTNLQPLWKKDNRVKSKKIIKNPLSDDLTSPNEVSH